MIICMVDLALPALCVIGLLATAFMTWSQRRMVRRPPLARIVDPPPVSILKPLCGIDADLETNIESFFCLDYPEYELVFGVQDPTDPALEVARTVAGRFPEVSAHFVVSSRNIGYNPKVNNLACIIQIARFEMVLISDSNVHVTPGYLHDGIAQISRPGVGLVTSLFKGAGGQGLGGALESLQLNTFVMGGVAALSGPFGAVCAVGKSMLIRRSDLERIGGFNRLSRYLAEDQVCGEEIKALGQSVVLSPRPVDNVLGRLGFTQFCSRQLRWARIRRHISPVGYAGEILLNPFGLAGLNFMINPGTVSAALAGAVLAAMSVNAIGAERGLGIRRGLAQTLGLEFIRSVTLFILWIVPFVSSQVNWRGTVLAIGSRTLLTPVKTPSVEADWALDLKFDEA